MNRRSSIFLLAIAGCTADPRPTVVSLPAATAPLPPPIEDSLVAVSARALPAAFAVDGDLAEWGDLDPKPPPAANAAGNKGAPAAAPPRAKPASRAVVGLDPIRFAIAAELRKASRDGIWIIVRFPVDELGPLGSFQRGGGVSPDQCIPQSAGVRGDDPSVQKCLDDLETAHRDYNAQFTARFERIYRLDKSGVKVLRDKNLVAIPDAKFVAKEHGDAFVVEAELPLAALPRASEAPVSSMAVAAMPASGEPVFADGLWQAADIAPPVAFAPNGELRSAVFAEARSPYTNYSRYHYQPGDAFTLSITGYAESGDGLGFDASRYQERVAPLFTPQRTFGAFEVGYVYPVGLATLRGSEFVSLAKTNGRPLGMAERGSELHVFFFERYASSDDWREHGTWNVLSVDGEGNVDIRKVETPPHESLLKVFAEFHAPDFSSFGYDGEQGFGNDDGPSTLEHRRWTWNAKQKAYVYAVKVTNKPPSKKTKKR